MRLKLQQIRELIGSSKLDEATRQLKEYISSEEKYQGFFNTILLLQSEYRRFQIDEIEGVADEQTLFPPIYRTTHGGFIIDSKEQISQS